MAAESPDGLAAAGLALWVSVSEVYTLRDDEAQVLIAACRTLDELATLEAALRDAPALIEGSKGQTRAHPLFAEVRAHRLALRSLLGGVGLVEAEADRHAGAARSMAGRRLARQRWDGGQRRGAA